MGEIERLVPSGIIEQWVYHLRRQRARAADAIWLFDTGYTVHDGKNGVAFNDATDRHRGEAETIITEVNALLALYDGISLGEVEPETT
jgi:hypothetical protein